MGLQTITWCYLSRKNITWVKLSPASEMLYEEFDGNKAYKTKCTSRKLQRKIVLTLRTYLIKRENFTWRSISQLKETSRYVLEVDQRRYGRPAGSEAARQNKWRNATSCLF